MEKNRQNLNQGKILSTKDWFIEILSVVFSSLTADHLPLITLLFLSLATSHSPLAFAAFKRVGAGRFPLATADLSTQPRAAVFPKVITPNNDGVNDIVFFYIENKTGAPWKGTIVDLQSHKVADVKESSVAVADTTVLVWDGKNESGSVVPAGIYIYKIELGDQVYTGCVGVAR